MNIPPKELALSAVNSLAAVLILVVLILILILVLVLVTILVLILILITVLILVVLIHFHFLRRYFLRFSRKTSLPQKSGFILSAKD